MADSLLGFLAPHEWRDLLLLEKQRRGLHPEKVVFVAARDLARVAWCPMQSLRTARTAEISLFCTYLEDRLERALDVGLITALPSDRRRWLELAARDVPLRTLETELVEPLPERFDSFDDYWEVDDGERSWAEPDLPTMRWHVSVDEYVIVAQPDGLSRTQVVEAKSARTQYLADLQRPLGLLQADLYGLVFRRPRKLMFQTIGGGDFVVDEFDVDLENAKRCVGAFARMETGWMPAPPPEAWKCRRCDVEAGCVLSRARERYA